MLYLDTSALLKLYVLEQGSEFVQKKISSQNDPLPVWEIQEMELFNALQLKVFWNELSPTEIEHQLALFNQRRDSGFYYTPEIRRAQLMNNFRKLSALTPETGCRTMNVLHVAMACQLQAAEFISFDERQKKLAVMAGLDVPDISD